MNYWSLGCVEQPLGAGSIKEAPTGFITTFSRACTSHGRGAQIGSAKFKGAAVMPKPKKQKTIKVPLLEKIEASPSLDPNFIGLRLTDEDGKTIILGANVERIGDL